MNLETGADNNSGNGGAVLAEGFKADDKVPVSDLDFYNSDKLELERLSFRYANYVVEITALKIKLAGVSNFKAVGLEMDNCLKNKDAMAKLKEFAQSCRHEASRRRAFRLYNLLVRVIPELYQKIDILSQRVS